MVVGVGFCKIKVDSNFLLVLKIKCTKFHQDRSKTVDLHTKYTNKLAYIGSLGQFTTRLRLVLEFASAEKPSDIVNQFKR
jgi:hypothetical protein